MSGMTYVVHILLSLRTSRIPVRMHGARVPRVLLCGVLGWHGHFFRSLFFSIWNKIKIVKVSCLSYASYINM
jgi:hypothetical protein